MLAKGAVFRHITGVVALVVIWLGSHIVSLNWGLPNPNSFAPDAVPMKIDRNVAAFLKTDTYRYPPLQYLIWDIVSPPQEKKDIAPDHYLPLTSQRLLVFRYVVACMTLGTSFALYGIALFLGMKYWSIVPGIIFLLTPSSIYYSHTTNMDQPYLFWYAVSIVTILYAKGNWMFIFGITMACSFCTKDMVYPYYLGIVLWYAFCLVRKKKQRSIPYTVFLWTMGFFFTCVLVYSLAGGKETFNHHLQWITGPGSKGWEQNEGTTYGRILLGFRSCSDLFFALDWVLFVLTGAFFWYIFKNKNDKMGVYLLTSILVLFLSFQVFFVQVTRFSFPRFYLPVVAACSIASGYFLMHLWRFGTTGRLVVGISIGIVFCLGLQSIVRLKSDTRIFLRDVCRKLSLSQKSPLTIGLDSSRPGKKYQFVNGSLKEIKALRDWSMTSFGIITSYQRSVSINSLFLLLSNPDFVVTGQMTPKKKNILENLGYRQSFVIEPRSFPLPSYFSPYPMPTLWGYKKTKKLTPSFTQKDVSENLEEQLQIFQACYHPLVQEKQLQIFGKMSKPFQDLKIQEYEIYPQTILLSATAYYKQGRLASARNAFAFLIKTYPHPAYVQMAKKLFADFPDPSDE